jgi:uncharacterized membrane protein (DUF485 family)
MTESTTPRSGADDAVLSEHDTPSAAFAADPDFDALRRSYRNFAFPATIAFMAWYITYVIANNWARGFMDTQVIGNINVAVVFGLLQFLSTFLIAYLYARHANRALDPLATRLRERFESGTGR